MNDARAAFFGGMLLLTLCVVAAGLVFGWPHAAITALSFCVYFLLRQMQEIGRLLDWVRQPLGTPPPVAMGDGVWDMVFGGLTRHHRDSMLERHQLNLALDRFRLAAEALPDGVVILDDAQQIEWMNRQAGLCLSLHATADVGTRILHLLREPEFQIYLADPNNFDHALLLSTTRSPGRFLQLQMMPFSAGRSLLLVRDTTQLVRMSTMRRDFVANVSHELKTPLTVTLGFLEALEDAPAETPPEERAHYVQMASTQARRMQSLIEDLLTLSMLETDAQPKDECVDLLKLIESVLADAQALSKNQHEILLEIDSPVIIIHGDKSELHSALLNLASNAVHYTPAGGRIVLHWRILETGEGELGVTDNGIGIALSDIDRLTERFFRTDRGRARVGNASGTGLGLAIAKQVVERHHSKLMIRSVLGQGSTFCIVFPADRLA